VSILTSIRINWKKTPTTLAEPTPEMRVFASYLSAFSPSREFSGKETN